MKAAAAAVALVALLAPVALGDAGGDGGAPAPERMSLAAQCADGHLIISRVRATTGTPPWESVRGHEDYDDVASAFVGAMDGDAVRLDMPTQRASTLLRAVHAATSERLEDPTSPIRPGGDRVTFDGATFGLGVLARCPDSVR